MALTLVLLAALMAAIVWWLLRQSINVQPWAAQAVAHDVRSGVLLRPRAKTGLWVFLAVATSLFALFVSAYAMRIQFGDWRPLPEPTLLAWNTAILVVSSFAMQATVIAARRGQIELVRSGLLISGVLTFAFVLGQLYVWKQLVDDGFFLTSSAATGFFYLLTAVHGLHVLGGLIAWARSVLRAWRGADAARLQLGVELCAIYWHFLLVVWVVLFAVLASEELGLAICVTPAAS